MKALALISGGLDSLLAARLIEEQGVRVIPINFLIPFCHNKKAASGVNSGLDRIADSLGQGLKRIDISSEFIGLLEKPRYGFGSNMNPCIDCKILMLTKAKELMGELGASFVVTGEVLGQRPMSQHKQALGLIEKKSGLEGLLLRPLSAKLLLETLPEKEGWVNREKLLNFSGRTRRPQIELANKFKMKDYQNPAGGCLLTDPQFSRRLKDLIRHRQLGLENIELLKLGRHFRLTDQAKLVVGRDEKEDNELLALTKDKDYLFMPPLEVAGPTCLGRGEFSRELLELAGSIACRYCDSKANPAMTIVYKRIPEQQERMIEVRPIEEDKLRTFRI
ncbi:MAG: tRNA 4-thiouridine(8) synthase ThiI [Candidatus Omnitrophica bacterium]|nr:tRNA 4-thiouridine(8) synthase ThiI [Candidatus Omnitrophota bacterium]